VFPTCNQQDQKPELSATKPAINGMDLQSIALGQNYLQLKIVQKVSTERINWTMIDGPDSWTPQAASRCEAGRLFLTVHKTGFSAPVEVQISVANKVGPTRMIAGRCGGLQVQLQIMWV
jgi:hypothetical protein